LISKAYILFVSTIYSSEVFLLEVLDMCVKSILKTSNTEQLSYSNEMLSWIAAQKGGVIATATISAHIQD